MPNEFREAQTRLGNVRANRAARRRALAESTPGAAELAGARFIPGDVVRDKLTGTTGTVIDTRFEPVLVPTERGAGAEAGRAVMNLPARSDVETVLVRWETGSMTPRSPAELEMISPRPRRAPPASEE